MVKKALKKNSNNVTGPYDSLRDYMEAIETPWKRYKNKRN